MGTQSKPCTEERAANTAKCQETRRLPVDLTLTGEHQERYQSRQAEGCHLDRVGLPDREAGQQHQHGKRVGAGVDGDQPRPQPDQSHQDDDERPLVRRMIGTISGKPLRGVGEKQKYCHHDSCDHQVRGAPVVEHRSKR